MDPQEIGIEFVKALHRYLTPLAVGIVLSGLVFGREIPHNSFVASIVLLTASLVFNMATAVYIVENPGAWRRWGYARVFVNLAINAVFYILLHRQWPMVWFLFALGPVAMAFYGDVAETFAVLGGVSLVMAACLLSDGVVDAALWGEAGARVFSILLLSLFLIKVSALIRLERGGRKA